MYADGHKVAQPGVLHRTGRSNLLEGMQGAAATRDFTEVELVIRLTGRATT
jgi:hypothetical protein